MAINRERLDSLLKCFALVFEEGKKVSAEDEAGKMAFKLFSQVHKLRMLIENPQEYFQSQNYTGIGDTSVPALPYQSTEHRRYYDNELRKKDALNIRTIGTKVSRATDKNLERINSVAEGYILPSSPSIQGLYEFLWLINKRLEGRSAVDEAPIFIDQKEAIVFEEIASYIALGKKEQKELGIFLSHGARNIASEITQIVRPKKFNDELEFNISTGATFYVATTSDKKLLELQKFFTNYGIKVKSLTELIGSFKDADELHGTIETNAVGKPDDTNSGKLYTVKKNITKELKTENALKEKLMELGDDPSNTFLLTDDRGSNLSVAVSKKLFERHGYNLPRDIYNILFGSNSTEAVIDNKAFPGSEIKHMIDATDGVANFWRALSGITANMPKENNYIENSIVVAITPIADCFLTEPRIFSTGAEVKFHIEPEARPELPYRESEQHTLSIKAGSSTLAEMLAAGEWQRYFELTDIGKALKSLSNNFNLEPITRSESSQYSGYQVGLVTSKDYEINGFKVNTLNDAWDISDPLKADNFMKQNNCYVFDGDIAKEDIGKVAYAFFKAVVAKQTDPRDMNKTIIINQPNENFEAIIGLYYSLYDKGYIKQYPPRMFSIADNENSLNRQIEEHLAEYKPIEFKYNAAAEAHTKRIEGESVFIACSASSDNQENIFIAAKTAYSLALSGKNIVYGSGDKKMMGAVYNGYMAAKEYAELNGLEFKSEILASSTDNILKIETLHGRPPEGIKPENFYLAETIEHRKNFLFSSSDSVIVLPGGAGTLEEFFYCSTRSSKEGRDYKVNVLNHKNGYDFLAETNGKNTRFFTEIDRLLENAYGVDTSKIKGAESFLIEKLGIPAETITLMNAQSIIAKRSQTR